MSIKKLLFAWSVFLIAILNVIVINTSAIAETVNTSEYFPLESGMAWIYLEDGLNSVTHSVLPGNEYIDGIATKVVQQSGGEYSGTTTNYSNNTTGISEHKEYSPDVFIEGVGFQDITAILTPPMKFANTTVNIGDLINSSGTVNYTFSGLGTFPLNYNSTAKFVRFENVTVPLGNFVTIKIQNSLTISGYINSQYFAITATRTFWLAKYIGLVKSISVIEEVQTTNELVSINFQPFFSADFTTNQITGVAPHILNFADKSDGNISNWLWNFGDSCTSTAQNPTHTYITPGSYTVSLTVSGPGGSAIETKTNYIKIALPGGDANNDNKVDIIDLILVLQILARAEPQPVLPEIADINGDMRTGLEEATYILQFISGASR